MYETKFHGHEKVRGYFFMLVARPCFFMNGLVFICYFCGGLEDIFSLPTRLFPQRKII
jgi:hypothetical protein